MHDDAESEKHRFAENILVSDVCKSTVANECLKLMIDHAEDTDRLRVGSSPVVTIPGLSDILSFITTELHQLAVYGE